MKYFLTVILLPVLQAFSQPLPRQIKPLQIGDTLPSITINTILNNPASQSNLSAFKGKWLILDFMATTCHGCIMALPHLDSLQRRFSNSVSIVLVSYEGKEKVKSFLKRNAVASKMVLPVIAEDTVLATLFKHLYLPHEVWISPTGVVKAITQPQYVNAGNIRMALEGKPLPWLVKNDMVEYDIEKPLIKANDSNGNISAFTYPVTYAALLKSIPATGSHYKASADTALHTVRLSFINMSPIELYLHAYGRKELPASHIVLNVKDTAAYVYDESRMYYDEWQLKNTFCFEAVFAKETAAKEIQQYILSVLDINLAATASLKMMDVDCLVLKDTAKKDLSRFKSYPAGDKFIGTGNIIYMLNSRYFHVPVLDERTGRQELNLPLDESLLNSLPALKASLAQFGYALQPAVRKLEMLKITEKKATPLLTGN